MPKIKPEDFEDLIYDNLKKLFPSKENDGYFFPYGCILPELEIKVGAPTATNIFSLALCSSLLSKAKYGKESLKFYANPSIKKSDERKIKDWLDPYKFIKFEYLLDITVFDKNDTNLLLAAECEASPSHKIEKNDWSNYDAGYLYDFCKLFYMSSPNPLIRVFVARISKGRAEELRGRIKDTVKDYQYFFEGKNQDQLFVVILPAEKKTSNPSCWMMWDGAELAGEGYLSPG